MTKEDLWWMPLTEYIELTDPNWLDRQEFLNYFPANRNELNAFLQYELDTKLAINEQTELMYKEHRLDMQRSDDYVNGLIEPELKYNEEYFQWHHLIPLK